MSERGRNLPCTTLICLQSLADDADEAATHDPGTSDVGAEVEPRRQHAGSYL